MEGDTDLVADICAASAAYLLTVLPALAALPPGEAFERLSAHFEGALLALMDGRRGWAPEPSNN